MSRDPESLLGDAVSADAVSADAVSADDDKSGDGYGFRQTWEGLWTQGVGEFLLLRLYWFELSILDVGAVFVALMFRRLAYLRHIPMSGYVQLAVGTNVTDRVMMGNSDAFRLRDVGYELIADHSDSEIFAVLGDVLSAYGGFMCMFPLAIGCLFRRRPATRPVFLTAIAVRWFRFLASVELLRPLLYLFTSMPAPDIHCVTHNETLYKPLSVGDAFTIGGVMSQGCGDLVFSGHMSMSLVCLFVGMHYMEAVYGRHLRPFLRAYLVLIACIVLADGWIILAVRHHYSVDLIAASVITYLAWHKYGGCMGQHDVHPLRLAARKSRCFVLRYDWCTLPADEANAPPVDPRQKHAELERMAAVAPWKGYCGGAWLVILLGIGCIVLVKMIFSSLHTAGVLS